MSCYIPYKDLESTLKAAYRYNFEKYKNLSSVIESVLGLDVQPEAKIHAIWYYAGFTNTLANQIPLLQTKEWNEGVYKSIHDYLKPFLTGEQSFEFDVLVNSIQGFFGKPLEIEEINSEDLIMDLIADLKNLDDSGLATAVDEIVKYVLSNQAILDPVIMDPQNTNAGALLQLALDQVNLRPDSTTNVTITNYINNVIADLRAKTTESINYINMRSAEGIGQYRGEPIFMLRKSNGNKIEVYYDRPNNQYRYYAPGTEIHETIVNQVKGDQITPVNRLKDNISEVNPDTLQLRMSVEAALTGLTLGKDNAVGEETTIQDQIATELPLDSAFYNSVQINATTATQKFNAERLARITKNFPSLGRVLETSERPVQEEALSRGNGPILTFVKPVEGFSITISDKTENKSFDLDTFINLAFVYSDNRVEPVDFDNPEHTRMLKNMLQVHTEFEADKFKDVTDSDIDNIKAAVLTYRAFENEVNELLQRTGREKADIRSIFYKYYDLSNSVITSRFAPGSAKTSPLSDYINASNNGLPVKIQRYDQNGVAIGDPENSKLAVIIKKQNGTWTIEDTLGENEKIAAVDKSGNRKVYETVSIYLEKVEEINLPTWVNGISPNAPDGSAVYVAFRPRGTKQIPTAIPVRYQKQTQTDVDILDVVGNMQYAMANAAIAKDNTSMVNFNNKSWGFDVGKQNGIKADIVQLPSNGSKKRFGIKFSMLEKPTNTIEQRAVFNEYAKKMSIDLSDTLLNGEGGLFDLMNQIFTAANITVPAFATTSDISRLANDAVKKLGANNILVTQLKDKYTQFSNDIKNKFNTVVNNHDQDVEDGSQITAPIIDKTFRDYGLFDGNTLKLYKRQTKSNVVDSYVKIDTIEQRRLSLTYRDPSKQIYIRPRVVKRTADVDVTGAMEPVVNVPKVEIPDPSVVSEVGVPVDINNLDIDSSDDAYLLTQSLEGFLTLSDEDFSKEISAMKELIPDTFSFTAEGFEGLNVDGHALGYLQGLMIHLNSTLKAKGVAYHEGFHAVYRRLLTDTQQAYYLQKVAKVLGDYKTDEKGKYIQVGSKKVYANEFRLERKFIHLNDTQIKNLIYEEYLADSFAEYMETSVVPKTWMQKLFAYLKRILNLFKKGGRINNLFYDISVGKFKNATITNSKANTEPIFSLYKGIPTANDQTPITGKLVNQEIQSYIIAELADKMTQKMAELSATYPDFTDDNLFDVAKNEVLKQYNIQDLIDQKPNLESEIRAAYQNHYANVRWILGQFHNSDESFKINNLSNQTYTNDTITKESGLGKKLVSISVANAESFKSDVVKNFNSINVLTDISEIDELIEQDNKESLEEEGGENFIERSSIGIDPGEGTAAFRRLFKYISYTYTDPRFGITRTRMVDSSLIFSTIRKITTNLSKEDCVIRISEEINRLTNQIDYFNQNLKPKITGKFEIPEDISKVIDLRDSLQAVFDTLDSMCGLREVLVTLDTLTIVPTKNAHVFIQFANVFNTIDARLLQIDLQTTEELPDILDLDGNVIGKGPKRIKEEGGQTYLLSDIVVGADLNKLREDIKSRLRTLNITEQDAKDSLAVLVGIKDIFKSEAALRERFTTNSGVLIDSDFREFIDSVYIALSKFNLNIPYDVVSTSLSYSFFTVTGRKPDIFSPTSDYRLALRANKSFFKNFEKLNYTFFSEMIPKAINQSIKISGEERLKRTSEAFENKLKEIGTAYVTGVGEFILKYDPTIAGSVTKNANGDLINKYCKPTPAYVSVLKLQSNADIKDGLRELIEDYFPGFNNYFSDNPLMNTNDPKVRAFLNSLGVSAFAGFQQRFTGAGNKQSDPTTFKGIDDRSYILSMFGLFAARTNQVVPETKEIFQTFKRILTQYEATSTSIVVDGIYKQYVDSEGNALIKEGVPVFVDDLMKVVEQEYNLIRKNFQEYETNSAPKLYKDYNLDPNKDRGFSFNLLRDFFQVGIDTKGNENVGERINLRNELIAAAKSNTSFQNEMKSNPQLATLLQSQLRKFGSEQVNLFNAKLRSLNIDGIDLPSKTGFSATAQIRDMFFNNWINGLFGNQLFDGPIAVGISSFANFYKRQKSGAAAGDNLYNVLTRLKSYRAAVVKTITFYIDDADLTKPAQLTPFVDERRMPLASNKEIKMFDGQSVGNLDRRIKIAEAAGQLDNRASEILRKMRYKTTFDPRYASDIEALRRRGIVFNSLKTVSASGFQYIKQSEHTLIRKDVSYLIEDYAGKAEIELANLYNTADYFKDKLEQGINANFEDTITGEVVDYLEMYKRTMQRAHSYFAPIKGRELLHNMLNSMEYHRIEQLMDEESSKKATVANKEDGGPLVIDLATGSTENILFDLDKAVENVPNELTYLQVETGKIAKTVTQGIQQKLLIIAQLDPSNPLYNEIKKDIEGYQKGLADAVTAQTKTMMRLLDTTDKQIVGKIFTKIADGLREQGGDDTMLQWFEVGNDGLPKYDPDLALITKTVVYYYYSMFNKNIFDKKIPGRKYYHVSPVGYQIIEVTDAQGNKRIVTQDEYKKNPSLYINATTRYPSVTTEPDGTMVVEVILPKELRNVDQKFLEKYLFKFFATRIPTEDKRSMMVAKVVDYIDEAYGASIIVPYQMHMLAGSDFDIDSLYAYVKSAYYAVDGTKMLYGDYTHYKSEYKMSEDEAKFMEYLTYMSNDDVIDELINIELVKISKESAFDSEIANRVGAHFGGNLENYFVNNASLLTVEETEDNKDLIKDFKRLVATFNVLSTLKKAELPTTPDSLKKYIKNTKSNPVVNVTLNNILQHKINILSNKNVYDKYMGDVNQRADEAVEDYKKLVKRRGLSESDLYNKQNLYTPTALVVARSLNSESKDSLGIAASFNKGVSMLATVMANLKEPVGSLYGYGKNNKPVKVVDTDAIIEQSVQLIGGAIGLFADAPKNPYPGPLHLTSITTPVMCTMFALGFPKEAAIMFQSMPAIVKLVQQYNQTFGSAYSRSSSEKAKSFNSFMKSYIADIETTFPDVAKVTLNKDEKVILDKDAYKLIWTGNVKPDTEEQLEANAVPIDNFGFNLLDSTGNSFDKELENYIIIKEFSNYIEMSIEISFKITKLTDALKGLKPDQMVFDRLLNTYTDLIKRPETSKFSNDSLKKLFERYPVLKESYESLKYMDKMSKVLMMERTSFMKGLTALFSNIWGYQTIDITTDLKAFIQLQLQKASMEKNPTGYFPELYLGLLDAQTFLSGDIIADYEYLKARYPMNAFLSEMTIRDEGSSKNKRVLEMSSSKISKNKKDAIKSDFISLLRDNLDVKEKAFKLAYYGMIKSGGQKARGGFYELLPAFLSKNMSDGLTNLRTNLVELDRIIEAKYQGDSFTDFDGVIKMPEDAYSEYKTKLDEILNKNFNGAKLDEIITEAISKIVSVKMLNDTVATYKRVTTLQKINKKATEKVSGADLKALVTKIAPDNSDSIVTITGERPIIDIPVKTYSKINEIELFVPVGTTLKLDLTSDFSEKEKFMIRSLGISPSGNSFYFPLYKMNIYDQMMVLKSIDGKSVGEVFIDTLAETEFSGTTDRLQLKGNLAEYEVVGKQGSPKISPIAFSAQQGTILNNLTMGTQQLTSVKTNQLPAAMRVVRTTNRMYVISKQVNKNVIGKPFSLLDLTTIKVSNTVNRYEYKAGMLGMYAQDGTRGAIVKEESYDTLAQRVGKANWEELKADPSFEDFLKGVSNLYVYHLDNGDINSPTNEPVVQPTQPTTVSSEIKQINVTALTEDFSRNSVENDPDYLYLFTDNAKRTSGSNLVEDDSRYAAIYGQGKKYPGKTQAIIRGLNNAFPITTMVDDKRTQWTDDKFEDFKEEIDSEIDIIKSNIKYFKGVKFSAKMPFGKGQISDMKNTAPKIWNYLNTKLLEIGIDNTGNIPTVSTTQPAITAELTSTDKIIWGHPGLGKTTFREQNPDKVLDFDTDFKPFIAKQLGLPVSEQNSVGLNKWRKENGDEEFNKLMRSAWILAKNAAKEQNKMLIVSDMIFLRESPADFDKVITTSKETFVSRATKRGDNVEILESWKEKLDETISTIEQSKVITTDKYFSELISTQPAVTETTIEYTPTGKQRQTYTIRGSKVFNKAGQEVFKEDSVDRNKIFANLAVQEGRAVVVEHKGAKYIVNTKNQIISGTTGKIMQWAENNGDRQAVLKLANETNKPDDGNPFCG